MAERIGWGSLVFGMIYVAIGVAVIAVETSSIGPGLGPAVALLIGGTAVLTRLVVSSRRRELDEQHIELEDGFDLEPLDLD